MVKQSQIKNAEHFNNFFLSIDKKLQNNIPPTSKYFSGFLKNPNNLTIFISLTTVEEENDLIEENDLPGISGN